MKRIWTLWVFLVPTFALEAESALFAQQRTPQQRVTPQRLEEPARIRPQAGRPLAIKQLRTTGLPAAERIALKPKYQVTKPAKTLYREGLRRDVVIVKFVDGTRIRELAPVGIRQEKSERVTPQSRLADLRSVSERFDDYDRALLRRKRLTPESVEREMTELRGILNSPRLRGWRNLFGINSELLADLRINAEIRRGRQASDLENYYAIQVAKGEPGERLADRLNQLDIVELAYLAPIPEDADLPPATPNFQTQQTHLNPAPGGIDARFAWTIAGGQGRLVRIIDIESGWNLSHEDLPSMFIVDGRNDTDSSRQHGTAVMGVMLGLADGTGVTGIVPQASGGVVSVLRDLGWAYFDNVAEAILTAVSNLAAGDVILIEQHARGPGNDNDCSACPQPDGKARSQCGYIAMEYWNDIFDAINAASAAGVIVVQAAGNGEMNLDHSRYNDRFNRIVRNSGALMVGAGDSASHAPLCFTNHGSRLDVQGWGENVTTAGYGSPASFRVNGIDDNQWYTTTFNGTSSATPVVAGAVAAIQGVQIENNNSVLDWAEIANLLKTTGTPQTGVNTIGPLPNLRAAIGSLIADQPPSPDNAVYSFAVTLTGDLLDSDRSVSGFTGNRTRVLGETADRGAIERLVFGERTDRPCYVRVEKADIVAKTIVRPHADLDLCGKNGPTNRSIDFVPLLTTSHDTFVHGVSVCNSKTKNNTRLKGVKLYRTRIEDDGSLSQIPNPSTLERPNCDGTWRTPTTCPFGSVATKLIAHIRDEGKDEILTGLALRCKKVEVVKTCVSGC